MTQNSQQQSQIQLSQQQPQQQPSTQGQALFSQRVGALPGELNTVGTRAIGLPETTVLLQQQMQYWLEHDGAEATASASGAKAAERTRRYIQHLLDRGGEAAPRCPVQLQLHNAQLRLREVHNQQQLQQQVDEYGNPLPANQQQQHVTYDFLTTEEQSLFASLAPLSYGETLNYIPTMGRFQQKDVEELISVLR